MWRIATALRERNSLRRCILTFTSSTTSSSSCIRSANKRFLHHDRNNNNNSNGVVVGLQLDYYMSSQFAGVANALVHDLYRDVGIDIVTVLPTCPVGLEQERVRAHQSANPTAVSLGSVEQNVFLPTLCANPDLRTTAVAAMFRTSPLALASLRSTLHDIRTIGAHEDTVDLLQRIFPHAKVVASPRATKNTDLLNGTYDAIQVYTTTEVPTLQRLHPHVTQWELEDLNDSSAQLGYSQVLFAANECLHDDRREVVERFLQATFAGWEMSIKNDPATTLQAVREAQQMLQLDDENNDHWHDEVAMEMLARINDHVKDTFLGDRYGVIDERRWSKANQWLSRGQVTDTSFGLDATVWQPSPQILSGNELARCMLEDVKVSATMFQQTHGRKPSLAVITVGELERYQHADRRLALYSNASNSWFSKAKTGEAHGIDVAEIQLPSDTSVDGLLSKIYSLSDYDGIQIMWPLPEHMDTASVYNAVDIAKDVDGIHFVGQKEIRNANAFPPVTPAAVMELLDYHGIDLVGKRVLVIGRSPIVGSPLAHMLRSRDAIVTVAHTGAKPEMLKELVENSEVVVTCAGCPGVVKAEWIKGAVVVNVGTTFVEDADSLCSDVSGDIAKHASQYSPVPGGVGPLSLPCLLRNTVRAAWAQKRIGGQQQDKWQKNPSTLSKTYHFDNYSAAVEYLQELDKASTVMDHHANIKCSHRCVDGVDVELSYFTYEANKLTEKDFGAAKVADMIYDDKPIRMSDYTYQLDPNSIAKYPASPRGSSRLLYCDENGRVAYFPNFTDSIVELLEGKHVVFNESRVLDARLYVESSKDTEVELMILDLGTVDLAGTCSSTNLDAMIRLEGVKAGDVFKETAGGVEIEVVDVIGVWEEDEKSDGNGTECLVRIKSGLNVNDFLEQNGNVPIPPYFHRKAEPADEESYNNVYAHQGGSVAAPTAGLHFTDPVLDKIGKENCSYLSLHVGAGTFKPVLVENVRKHAMHAETFAVSVHEVKNILNALKEGKPLVVVGTTSLRTLESLYWCGVKRLRGLDVDTDDLHLKQFEWMPLMVGNSTTRTAALAAIVEGLNDEDIIHGATSLMIVPQSYEIQMADHLITNFHAPDSTLMLLVSAFLGSGSKVRRLYEDAQANGYRFLSYGDSCFFTKPK